MEFTINLHRVSRLRINGFIFPLRCVHSNNSTFIPLLNSILIHFNPVHTTKLIYLRQVWRMPPTVFLDVSGGMYGNDILKDSFRNFHDYPCVLHVLPMSESLIKTWQVGSTYPEASHYFIFCTTFFSLLCLIKIICSEFCFNRHCLDSEERFINNGKQISKV